MMDDEPPGAELFLFDPEELDGIVTAEVGGSALFASRFRECAARALLLPRQNPGKRSPLWQQRQRSRAAAGRGAQVPAASRSCSRRCASACRTSTTCPRAEGHRGADSSGASCGIVETTTEQPSPVRPVPARSATWPAFLYEGDSPLAERRAAALSLDPTLLDELLGRAELRELLDPTVIAATEAELQRWRPDRRARGLEGVVDLLRLLGPLSVPRLPNAGAGRRSDHGAGCQDTRVKARRPERRARDAQPQAPSRGLGPGQPRRADPHGGRERYAAIEDAARLRDALGIPLPIGVPLAFIEPVADPLGDLVGRYARTHGPFTAADAAARLGLGVAVVLVRAGPAGRRRTRGRGRVPARLPAHRAVRGASGATSRCCAACAAARWPRCAPRSSRWTPATLGRFLPAWQTRLARSPRAPPCAGSTAC